MSGWKYYNHAAVTSAEPHRAIDITDVEDGSIWEKCPKALFACWTTDWDSKEPTNWWYVIKDQPFDLSQLNSKRRYEINKGRKNFEIRVINPLEYSNELYDITYKAYLSWPPKYRPTLMKEDWNVDDWPNRYRVYGAFYTETDVLEGYACLKIQSEKYIDFSILRVNPDLEKFSINAAIVYGLLDDNREFLKTGGYICDGARSINHETKFQDYLEKYFCFRKAYCKLNVVYRNDVKQIVKIIFPFRKILKQLDQIGIIHKINAVLTLEEIMREEDCGEGKDSCDSCSSR